MNFRTLQANSIRSNKIQSLDMQHKWVRILKNAVWNMAVLGEDANSVKIVSHTKVQSLEIIHLYITNYFFVTIYPLPHCIVVQKLVHNVNHLDITGICRIEGCSHTLIFVSSLWLLLLLQNKNSLQVNLWLWVRLVIRDIIVHVLGSNTLYQHHMPYSKDKTKTLLTCIRKYHIVGEVVVPTGLWLSII